MKVALKELRKVLRESVLWYLAPSCVAWSWASHQDEAGCAAPSEPQCSLPAQWRCVPGSGRWKPGLLWLGAGSRGSCCSVAPETCSSWAARTASGLLPGPGVQLRLTGVLHALPSGSCGSFPRALVVFRCTCPCDQKQLLHCQGLTVLCICL